MIESGYKEGLFYVEEADYSSEKTEKQIRTLLSENHGVGIIGGYYEPDFPVCMVSELAVNMLGYESADELLKCSGGNMAGLVSGGLSAEFSKKFEELNGTEEVYLHGKGKDLWVRIAKRDGYVDDGRKMWLISVCNMDALYRKELQVNRIILEKKEFESMHREKLARANAELEAKNRELERALAAAELNNETISAIGKIYWLVYRLDLIAGTYEEVSVNKENRLPVANNGFIKDRVLYACENTISPEYKELMADFLNVETLPARLANREEISQQYHIISGHWYLGRFIVQRRDSNGKAIKVLYTIQIIDEQKEQELEYEKKLTEIAEEAQKASVSKTDFLRRMSHDIRTPINGIRGMIEIADSCPYDIEKQKECRVKVMEASGYLLSLVNSVLDMNKLESGETVLASVPFDLVELLDEVNTVAEMQAIDRGISYRVLHNGRSIEHRYLIGSPMHVKQVLINVAENAVKYNKENGSVKVWSMETSCKNGRAVFEFVCEDNGIGMSEEFQKHAFEAFSQERKNSARTLYAGSGRGLSIVKSLVEQMGGSVELKSRENEGSAFRITLPFKIDENPPEKEVREEEETNLEGAKILVAEDNSLNMEIVCFFLRKAGAEAVAACDGEQAVKLFEQSAVGEYSAILMDVLMPVVGGYEATRAIRNSGRDDADVPIIAMSANAFEDDVEKSRKAGMNEHFSKPLDIKSLMKTIRKYVDKNKEGI